MASTIAVASLLTPLLAAAPARSLTVPASAYGFAYTSSTGNDGFYTWDSGCSAIGSCNIRTLVDNPVDFIWYNDAYAPEIRNSLAFVFCCGGSNKWGYYRNLVSGTKVAADSGRKNCNFGGVCGPSGQDVHYRMYPYSIGAMGWLPGWGFYIFATVHYDNYEGSAGEWFGDNENAEIYLAIASATISGWTVYPGWSSPPQGIHLGNTFTGWVDSTNYRSSDGWATAVHMPV